MKKHEFFVRLVESCFDDVVSESEVLACMIIIHTHRLKIKDNVYLDDAGGAVVLMPVTQRHASEIICEAMGMMCEDQQYWYNVYNSSTPFEVASDIPDSWRIIVSNIAARMKITFINDWWPD